MQIEPILAQIRDYQARGLRLFCTSSFQTQSVPLLHILSQIDREIPVVFLHTGFLFPETLAFRDELVARLGIRILEVRSEVDRSLQRDAQGRFLFASDPDRCCYLNKVQPLDAVLRTYDVWINGVRRDQTAARAGLQVEQRTRHGVLRYHPMLEFTERDIYRYIAAHDLPTHPLEEAGYASIGCEPCTRRVAIGDEARGGRWAGLGKTECGLHTDLARPEDASPEAR